MTGGPLGGPSMAMCAVACDYLLKRCVEKGAHDNLSALIIMCGMHSGIGSGSSSGVGGGIGSSSGSNSNGDVVTNNSILPSVYNTKSMMSPEPSHTNINLSESSHTNFNMAESEESEEFSTFMGTPSSGIKDRTPTDRTLSRVFAINSPSDSINNPDIENENGDENGDRSNTSVNRQLEFSRESH